MLISWSNILKKIVITIVTFTAIIVAASALAANGTANHHHLASASGSNNLAAYEMRRLDKKFSSGIRVTASPFLGTYTLYDTNALLSNQPTMNEDLVLLEQHALMDKVVDKDSHYAYPASPLIDISGALESGLSYNSNYASNSTNSIALNRAEVDVGVFASPWITGYMSLATSNAAAGAYDATFGRGWLTVGNLNESPIYFSMGKMYVPFGSYSSAMLSNPLTKTMFRTSAPTAVVGFASQAGSGNLYAQTYAYQGPSSSDAKTGSVINGWGGALGYKGKYASHVGYDIGVGYINNIANAAGQQSVADGAEQMAGAPKGGYSGRRLAHDVGGMDLHLTSSYDKFTFMGEWITALDKYATTDMQYDGKGAQPSAMHLEGDYAFNLMSRNAGVFLGYDHSWQALQLAVPEQSIIAGMSSNIWHYTVTTLEYRHDMNYKSGTTASIGKGAAAKAATSNGWRPKYS